MHFPRHWAKGRFDAVDRDGRELRFSCWGWSDQSREDAAQKGAEAARRVSERILMGDRPRRYPYGERPLREEILEQLEGPGGDVFAAISRNSYGCLVLNAKGAMFVDVDLPRPGMAERLCHSLGSLLGRKGEGLERKKMTATLSELATSIRSDPALGVRVYRTRAGLRYLFTHGPVDPRAPATTEWMSQLHADPLYVRLCKSQDSFRARLTPKPWRCGMGTPTDLYPWAGPEEETEFRAWEERYRKASSRFATCELVTVLGSESMPPELARIVALHDDVTRATSGLALA